MNNTRRQFLKNTGVTSIALFLSGNFILNCSKNKKYNILWLIAEDLSPDIGCYGTKYVKTPNLDRFASEGVLFKNAFTTASVCSASRSAFMTGMYQTSIGAHQHRSHLFDNYMTPEPCQLITEYFHQAGYFTSNCSGLRFDKPGKTDWNFSPKNKAFDGTDWRQRKDGQPFFAQVNFREVHRMIGDKPDKLTVDPDLVDLPPYYPDHPVTRKDWAEYLSAIEILDKKVGKVLDRLKKDGLEDNTIVFFFGDHGRGHVRGKGWLYDGGIKIPLIIRWPDKLKPGSINDELISAIDFAPTCLNAVGFTPPDHFEGSIFLGSHKTQREHIIAARDRIGECVDRIRCVRTHQHKYIRNYHPEKPYTQYSRYVDAYNPVMRLMHRLHKKNQLTPEQALFMAPQKPVEELYDLINDPHELNNLAEKQESHTVLQKFRKILDDWIADTGDKGQFPEDPEVVKEKKRYYKTYKQDMIDSIYAIEKELY